MHHRPIAFVLLVLFLCSARPLATNSQNYPARSVRIVEPFGAGGGPDLLARALAPQLQEIWRQPVTVENVTGQGATAGPALVAKASPDGYTLLINTNAQAYSAAILKNLSYDPLKDFIAIVPLTKQPYVLVANKSAGFTSITELRAAAKAKPNQLRFGSTGIGTSTHIGVEQFNMAAGIKAIHVPPLPTDSNANMIANVISGHTTYCLSPISLALPAINDGRLNALGVSTTWRSPLLPTVPTIAESGIAGFDFPVWYGTWVPANTPRQVIEKLSQDLTTVMARIEMREWMRTHGAEPMTMTPTQFARFIQSETNRAKQIMKAVGKVARNTPD